jgi:hypothetical protein
MNFAGCLLSEIAVLNVAMNTHVDGFGSVAVATTVAMILIRKLIVTREWVIEIVIEAAVMVVVEIDVYQSFSRRQSSETIMYTASCQAIPLLV